MGVVYQITLSQCLGIERERMQLTRDGKPIRRIHQPTQALTSPCIQANPHSPTHSKLSFNSRSNSPLPENRSVIFDWPLHPTKETLERRKDGE